MYSNVVPVRPRVFDRNAITTFCCLSPKAPEQDIVALELQVNLFPGNQLSLAKLITEMIHLDLAALSTGLQH